MATQAQIDTNRRNSQKSTGPRSPEGKAAVSRNALKHGFRSRDVVLPGEDRSLMTNHVHLVVVPERGDSLAVLFRRVHGRYAQYSNARYGRIKPVASPLP